MNFISQEKILWKNYGEELDDFESILVEYDVESDKVFLELVSLPALFNFAELIAHFEQIFGTDSESFDLFNTNKGA